MQTDDNTTCKSCKHRYDDGHFYFPACWLMGHLEENKNKGKNCQDYEFDRGVLQDVLIT